MSTTGRRGSVGQSANGTWYFVVDTAVDGGRTQTRRRGFATRRAAKTALTKTLQDLAGQAYVPPSRQTLAAFLTDDWLPAIRTTVRASTFDSYERNMRLHVAQRFLGRVPLQRVDAAGLNKLYALLVAPAPGGGRPLSARSVTYIHMILHRAFRDAIRWDRLVRNPCESADPPKVLKAHRSTMRTWSGSELAQFLASVADHRLQAAWWLLATTGMRRGEVLGLGWDAVDLDGAVLSVRRTLVTTQARRQGEPGMSWSQPKTEKGWRVVALDDATVAVLRSHRVRQLQERMLLGGAYDDQDLVVCQADGTPLHPKTLSYHFAQASRRAGLPVIRLHDLRHSHATLALKAGIHPRVVQERLGHANVGITLDTYSHVSMPMQAEAAARVAALMTPTEKLL